MQKSNRTDNNKYYTYTIMNKKLNLILFALFSIFSLNINAHDFEMVNSDGKTIYYDITSSADLTVSVSYRGSSYNSYTNEYEGDISISSSVLYNGETYSVTSIGDHAFHNCDGLTSITIPNSVTSIGDWAFRLCDGLTSVTIPNSVSSIGDYAFSYCDALTSVTIGNGVTSIGDDAFEECDALTSINVDSDNPSYASLNGVLFNKEKTELIIYPKGKEGSYTIPNSVTSIEDWAFSSCDGLTSVTIGNGVTSIGNNAFSYCDGLTSVTIGNSVTSIGYDAFFNCSALTSVTIGNGVTSIGYDAFEGCDALTSINVDSDNPSYTSLNGVLFNKEKTELIIYPKEKEGSYTIPNSVTSIGDDAFKDCDGLTSVTIGNGVTSIGNNAFSYCDGLTSVTIGNSVTSIGYYAFFNCSALTSINVDSDNPSYTSLNGVLFNKEKTELIICPIGKEGSYTIPNSVTSIGDDAFRECDGLTSITIPNSVTSIGDDAICSCDALTSVTIGNGVTSIGDDAFWNCDALTSINVDSDNPSYTSLNGVLFNKGKTELIICPRGKEGPYTIPNSVTSIGEDAFKGCDALTSVTIPNSVTSIGDYAFMDCYGLTSVTIPNSVTSIGNYAFYYCYGLTSVTIPNSVTSIGNYAFYSCVALTEIYSLSSDPAVCGAGPFWWVDETIPVYIPYGSMSAYKSASEWKEFTNFIESEFTGVDEEVISTSDIKVISGNGIEINDYYGRIRIVNIAGQVVKDAYVNGYIQLSLPKGIYIVVTENYSQKVIL